MKELKLNCQKCGGVGTARAYRQPMARGFHLLIKCGDHWALKNKLGKERPIAGAQEREKIEAWLSKNGVKLADIPEIPASGATDERCAVCGECGQIEAHHLAPRAVFGEEEAGSWPMVDVCASCHDRWHSMMVGYQWNRPVRADRDDGIDPNVFGLARRRATKVEP